VLKSRFSDPDYAPADLDLLTASGDLHLSPEACSVSAGQSVRIRVTQVAGGFTREHRFLAGEARYVLTVPVVAPTGSAYVVQVARLDAGGTLVSSRDTTVRLAVAQDIAVRAGCDGAALPALQGHYRGTETTLTGGAVRPRCFAIVKVIGPTVNPSTTLGDGDFIFIMPPNDIATQFYLPSFEIAGGRVNKRPGDNMFRYRNDTFSSPDAVLNRTTITATDTIQVEEIFSTTGTYDGTRLSVTILHSVFHTGRLSPRTFRFDENRRYDLVRTASCP
jgi:hypothetical protein